MQLIPSLVLQHLANPANIETLFIQYIEKAGLRIDSSKTIAGIAYFHKQVWGVGDGSKLYFSGPFDATLTNMPGNSFVRPQSEHSLIWAMRLETASGADPRTVQWTPGLAFAFFLNSTLTVTTNSEVKIKDYPLSEALTDLTVRDNGLIPIPEPIFWGGQQDFKIDVVNPTDKPIADTCLKITLIGLGLI